MKLALGEVEIDAPGGMLADFSVSMCLGVRKSGYGDEGVKNFV